jgi:hypothetical protein
MKISKAISLQDYNLIGKFEEIKKTLARKKYTGIRDRHLGYWVLAGDRGLPHAFLGQTLGGILETSFEDLVTTPGVGQKKIALLIELLERASREDVAVAPPANDGRAENGGTPKGERFDPTQVSEAAWQSWKKTVVRWGLEDEVIGRLAPSLQPIPTVIWDAPLSDYLDNTLADIRARKTHGEKRIRIVLEVFHLVHALLGKAKGGKHLRLSLTPKLVCEVEAWLESTRGTRAQHAEIRDNLAAPLIKQLEDDAGKMAADAAAKVIGLRSAPQRVALVAERIGVTRARVYQMLDQCGRILAVRWPRGQRKLTELTERYQDDDKSEAAKLLNGLRDLLFPDKG